MSSRTASTNSWCASMVIRPKPDSFMGFIKRCLSLLTKANIRHKIGTEVKDIKSRIQEVSKRRNRYKVKNIVAKPIGPTIIAFAYQPCTERQRSSLALTRRAKA